VTGKRFPNLLNGSVHALFVASLIGFCVWLSIQVTRPAHGVTIIWVASGLLAGILLTSPRRRWLVYIGAALAGNLLARALCGDALAEVFSRGIASTLDACLVAFALRVLVGDITDPGKLSLVVRVAMGSTLLACALSALMVAATAAAIGSAPFKLTLAAWFASHTLGMIIFTTLFVVARNQRSALLGRRGERWKFIRSICLVAATTLWVFSQSRYPLLFMTYPPLLLVVFRHRFAGVVVGVTVVMLISVIATVAGSGPLYLVAGASLQQHTLLLQLFIATTCLITLPVAVVLTERIHLGARLRDSEQGYRTLAEHSRDLVVRIRADGHRLYVSPSVKEILGWEPSEVMEPRWDLVHPDDHETLIAAMTALYQSDETSGDITTVIYRALHRDGHYVWIEALARLVPSLQAGFPPEIIYSGRDISRRVDAEKALIHSEQRLRAVTDNIPALVARVDSAQRYTFANAMIAQVLGIDAAAMIGKTVREVRGELDYATLKNHLETALSGKRVTFEGVGAAKGRPFYYQCTYIPDLDADGAVCGIYAMTFDISELERAKQELSQIAQHDSLTGVGNRNKFDERLTLALARAWRTGRAIALIYIDLDYFKAINDNHGHPVGDAVLRELAKRLQKNVRVTDLVARLGGDEFAVIIEDTSVADAHEIIARELTSAIRKVFVVNGMELRVTASIGVGLSRYPTTAEALMLAADSALYDVKKSGRNGYRVVEIPAA